jgi:Tol biopolymer transport system component
MTDLRDRLRDLDGLDVPDIISRARELGPRPFLEPPSPGGRRIVTAVFALLLSAAAIVNVIRVLEPATTPNTASPTPTASPSLTSAQVDRRILFIRDERAFTTAIDGSGEQVFADDQRLDVVTTLSPDRTRLAFVTVNDQGTVVGGTVNVDGSNYRLFEPADPSLNLACGWWGPDDRIACEGWDDADPSRAGIYTVRASDGRGLRRLTSGREYPCSYSPDGTRLAFIRVTQDLGTRTERGKLMVMNADGGEPRVLLEGVGESGLACDWSPDGKTIVAGTSEGSIVLVSPRGTRTPLHGEGIDGYSEGFVWSVDGARVMFSMNLDGQFDVYTVGADGTGLARITDSAEDEFGLAWLP